MRAWLAIAVLLLGADYPRHRRFLQRSLPKVSSCVPATGAVLVDGNWADLNSGGLPTTRTVNFSGPSPGCGNDYERVIFQATASAQYSSFTNTTICPAGANVSYGFWAKAGPGGAGTTDVCSFNGTVWACSPIAFTSTATFFKVQNAAYGGSGQLAIGNLSAVNGATARNSSDVLLWGVRCVAGATISQ